MPPFFVGDRFTLTFCHFVTPCRYLSRIRFPPAGIESYTEGAGEYLSNVELSKNNKPATGGHNDHQFHTGRHRRQAQAFAF